MFSKNLNRTIVLLRATTARDAANHLKETFAALATCAASYSAVSDGEKFNANQTVANISGRFIIRWSALYQDLSPKDRLTFDGKTYDILNVKEVTRRRWLEITAAARADGG